MKEILERYVVRVNGVDYPMLYTNKANLLNALKDQLNKIEQYWGKYWAIHNEVMKKLEEMVETNKNDSLEHFFLWEFETLLDMKKRFDTLESESDSVYIFEANDYKIKLAGNDSIDVYSIEEWFLVSKNTKWYPCPKGYRNEHDDGVRYIDDDRVPMEYL